MSQRKIETSRKWLEDLQRALPEGRVSRDPEILDAHRHDEAGLVPSGHAAALVRPRSTAEVQTAVRVASRHRVPIVPRGAGTGLAGGANAIDGCLVLSLVEMNRILEIDPRSLLAVVQPGVVNAALGVAAREHGLWYPPDPASYEMSTLGGNVATNAGGLCCVKYGVTRDSVLGLEVVLADGEVLRTGARTRKSVPGYDLTSLFVGSEGTLGIVTEATLRLRPLRGKGASGAALAAFFPTLAAAGEAITAIVGRVVPALLELMDQHTVRAVEDWKRMDLDTDAAALLFAASDAGGDEGRREIAEISAACEAAGASYVAEATDQTEVDLLLMARRLCYPAFERLGATLLDDVAVPIARIVDLLEAIERIAAEHDVVIGTFGHAGDGNMHPTIVFDRDDAAAAARARAAFDAILAAALELGGTITGEHGIGLLKAAHLGDEIGPVGLRVHRAIKRALDPHGLFNPGKVVVG